MRSVNDIMPMIGARFYTQLDAAQMRNDVIEEDLAKLDAGVPEKISLISRDEKSVLVVTYSDLKRCFENTFQELIAAANGQL
ncbi:hypothetical protein CB1_001907067 [Camelus ferus]|nr:hypothetical protein CB1_001907067 [Camelus ferus]